MSRIKSREEGVREVPAETQARPSDEDELRRWAERAARNWRFRQSLLPQPRTQPGQIEMALERMKAYVNVNPIVDVDPESIPR